jgi:signal transduction histidine kinase
MAQDNSIKTEELLSLLCHDLSNPLQILGMSLEVLEDRCSPDLLKLVQRMKRSTDSITQILTLVRELQAFSAGKKALKIEAVSLEAVIEQNLFSFQEKLLNKNITIEYTNNCEDSNPMVLAEYVSLSNNVFKNILSNAIKFSEENSVVKISLSARDQNIIVTISDKGIGIPKMMLENIFSYNKETSRLGTKGEKGTGFGMPLVKLFLDLYGVKVKVSSFSREEHPNAHGTTFELVFQKAA